MAGKITRGQPRRVLCVALSAVAICAMAISPSSSQVGALGGTAGPTLTPPPVSAPGRDDPFAKRNRDYGALPVGDWLVYPTVFAGAIFDSNVNQSSTSKTSSWGARLVPSLLAERTDGIHKTTLYGMADGRVYSHSDTQDTVAARAGFIQRYQPMSDLVFNAQADYTRQKDLFSTFGIDHSVTTLNPTAIGLAPTVRPLTYNQFSGTGSVQKTFDRAFVSFAGSIVDIVYDSDPALVAASPDGSTFTGTGRGGFWFTPYLYAYVEGSLDQRRFSNSQFNSHGYRTVGGIGTDQIGLFRGEVYGGYQSQRHDFAPLGTVNSTVFGGRVYYYPTRALTISASVDESLGVSLLQTIPGVSGTSTRATTALLQATYSLAREWAASARLGFIHTDFVGTVRQDDAWTGGATITYSVWQNFGLTLDYQHIQVTSNVPVQGATLTPTGFTRDVVTLGGTYRY